MSIVICKKKSSVILQMLRELTNYLVPGLLVQVYAAVQWDSLYQLHGQNPAARQLIDHLRDLEKLIPLQHGPGGQTQMVRKKNH